MAYEHVRDNPFTPSFGEVPLIMAGRAQVIQELDRSFSSTSRRPILTSVISGARGTGKTALLTFAEAQARERGWVSVSLVSLPGLLEEAYEQSCRQADHVIDMTLRTKRISSLGIGPMSVGISHSETTTPGWRTRMNVLLDRLAEKGAGLLMTIDEITPRLDELIQLTSAYQLFVREERRVALLMAGLPHNVSLLLNDKSVSFLRRAESIRLGRIADHEIERALRDTFAQAGRSVSDDVIEEAVHTIGGFPFMMQLVGFNMWEEGGTSKDIKDARARRGIRLATEEFKTRILLPSYQELSPMDRRFLQAMLQDEGDSLLSTIARRLGKTNSYATQYKNRLLEHGIIGMRGSRSVGFELPSMREFLVEQKG